MQRQCSDPWTSWLARWRGPIGKPLAVCITWRSRAHDRWKVRREAHRPVVLVEVDDRLRAEGVIRHGLTARARMAALSQR